MKSNYRFFLLTLLGTFSVFVMTVILFSRFSSSYAIPTGVDRSGIPSSTFTSNVTSNSKTNYMQAALSSESTSIISNFAIPANFKSNDNTTPLYQLMKNLDTPTNQEQFEIIDNNPESISDNGIQYILAHGYNISNLNHTIFTSGVYGSVTDNNIKQYVTQIALWLYIYENKTSFADSYCINEGCDFKNTSTGSLMTSTEIRNLINTAGSNNNFQYLKYIIALVDQATDYEGREPSQLASFTSNSLSYQINDNATLLLTDAITPSASSNQNNYLYYSVEIQDPNSYGVYLVDTNNNELSSTNTMNGSFKIAVPLRENLSDMDLSSIEIQIYGHFVRDDGYAYRVTSSTNPLVNDDKTQKYSDILYGYTPSEVVGTSFNLYNFVKVSKIDVTNSNELPGAKLEITKKDQDDWNISWTSTDKPHYIGLDNGSYTLCETTAPEGYQLNTECIDFEVDDSHIVAVEMKNSPIVPTEDTGLFSPKVIYFIGFLFTITGVIWMLYVIYQYPKKSK